MSVTEARDIKTFVFLDLEATGLPSEGRPRITEISLVSIHKQILQDWQGRDEIPRVLNKFVSVVCPMKPISQGAAQITGLYNEQLEYQKDFDEQLVESIALFLQRHEKPVCLVAHNGIKFDFSLLRSEYESLERSLDGDLLCVDTLVMCRELQEGETVENTDNRTQNKSDNSAAVLQASSNTMPYTTPEKTLSPVQEDGADTTPIKRQKNSQTSNTDEVKVNRQLLFTSGEEGESSAEVKIPGFTNSFTSQTRTRLKENNKVTNITGACGDSERLKYSMDYSQSHMNSGGIVTDEQQIEKKCDSTSLESGSQGMVDFLSDQIAAGQFESLESFGCEGNEEESEQKSVSGNIKDGKESTCGMGSIELETTSDIMAIGGKDDILQNEEVTASTKRATDIENMTNDRISVERDESGNECSVKVGGGNDTENGRVSGKVGGELGSTDRTISGFMPPPCVQRRASLPQNARSEDNGDSIGNTASHSTNNTNKILHASSNIQKSGMVNTKTPYKKYKYSYKLPDIHKRLVGHYPVASHTAEDDCISLLRICQKIGPDFINWVNKNAVPVNTVGPLYPKSPRKRKVLETGTLAYNS